MKKCFILLSVILLGYQASVGNNNHTFSDEDLPVNYVTISSNGVEVAQVIVPIEKYGECEVIWTIMNGLTCEGQVISSNIFAIATFVNGVWQQNKHENWVSPTTDSGGWDISGTGEGGSTQYNFRYSIGIPTPDYNGGGGVMQNGTYKSRGFISRKDNNTTAICDIYDTFFSFDFYDGAWFQISFEGEILYTSEVFPINKYKDTYGVSIKNYTRTDSIIEFDLIDGEYSESDFAHYVVDLYGKWHCYSILREDNNATTYCEFYDNYFSFDYDDGALFSISLDGEILYTSEVYPIEKYSSTFGVCIKNFTRTGSKIEFDLLDGEYSETDFAHYIIDSLPNNNNNNNNNIVNTLFIDYNEWFSFFDTALISETLPMIIDDMYVVPVSEYSNHYWSSQLCNVLHGINGQEEGNSFELTFDVKWNSKTSYKSATIYFLTGKAISNKDFANNRDYQYMGDKNTEILNEENNPAFRIPFEVMDNDWTTINIKGKIGEKGKDFIGIELDLAGDVNCYIDSCSHINTGTFYFKNIVINIGGTILNYNIRKEVNSNESNNNSDNGIQHNTSDNEDNGNNNTINDNNYGNNNQSQPSTPAGIINQGIFDIIHQVMTDVDEDEANTVNIYADGNTIAVENATDEIRVYNAMGALVCREMANRIRAKITVNGTGVYIVKTGKTVKRVFVN